jgi:hypothetical protein
LHPLQERTPHHKYECEHNTPDPDLSCGHFPELLRLQSKIATFTPSCSKTNIKKIFRVCPWHRYGLRTCCHQARHNRVWCFGVGKTFQVKKMMAREQMQSQNAMLIDPQSVRLDLDMKEIKNRTTNC